MFSPKNLRDVLMPVTILCWIFAIGIVEYPAGRPRRLLSVSYAFVGLVLYIYGFFVSFKDVETFYSERLSPIAQLTYKMFFSGNCLLTAVVIVLSWGRAKKAKPCAKNIEQADRIMSSLGIGMDYRKLFVRQLYIVGMVCCFIVIMVGANLYWCWQKFTSARMALVFSIITSYSVVMMCIADLTFVTWVQCMGRKFRSVNGLLKGMLTTTIDSPQHKRVLNAKRLLIQGTLNSVHRNSRELTETMKTVRQLHLELVKICRKANDLFGVQLLLSMLNCMILITGLIYGLYTMIFWSKKDSSNVIDREIGITAYWTLLYASKIYVINHFCATTSLEASKTGDIICELHEPSTSKEFRAEIRAFTLQLIQNPLSFTACGFFTLDYTFIHGVIGSVTTYLVILIQIGDIPTSGKNETMTNMTNQTLNGTSNYSVNIF